MRKFIVTVAIEVEVESESREMAKMTAENRHPGSQWIEVWEVPPSPKALPDDYEPKNAHYYET